MKKKVNIYKNHLNKREKRKENIGFSDSYVRE